MRNIIIEIFAACLLIFWWIFLRRNKNE